MRSSCYDAIEKDVWHHVVKGYKYVMSNFVSTNLPGQIRRVYLPSIEVEKRWKCTNLTLWQELNIVTNLLQYCGIFFWANWYAKQSGDFDKYGLSISTRVEIAIYHYQKNKNWKAEVNSKEHQFKSLHTFKIIFYWKWAIGCLNTRVETSPWAR